MRVNWWQASDELDKMSKLPEKEKIPNRWREKDRYYAKIRNKVSKIIEQY